MLWLVIGAFVALYVIRILWRAHVHPAQVLVRQGANMNWTYSRTVKDPRGYRLTCLERSGMEAMVEYDPAQVRLLRPAVAESFSDFLEVERWISLGQIVGRGGSRHTSPAAEFDPGILSTFEREISTWPASQAHAALSMVRAVLAGDDVNINELAQELTVDQIQAVEVVVREIQADSNESQR